MDVAAIQGSLTSLKTAFDIAKGLHNLKRQGEINSAIRDIQSALMDAQTRALDAQANQAALIQEINKLKADIARFEAWDREKERYELYHPATGITTYALKETMNDGEEPMQICANCYQDHQASILQSIKFDRGRAHALTCPRCGQDYYVHGKFDPEHRGAARATYRR